MAEWYMIESKISNAHPWEEVFNFTGYGFRSFYEAKDSYKVLEEKFEHIKFRIVKHSREIVYDEYSTCRGCGTPFEPKSRKCACGYRHNLNY